MSLPEEQRALLAVLLHAAMADGIKSDAERAALKRITQGLVTDALNPWLVYQDVLAGRYPIEAAVADVSPSMRLLAYEMALGVCETDGAPNAAERVFLDGLRAALALPAEADASERAAAAVADAVPAAAPAGVTPPPASAQPAVDSAALDRSILTYAILTGALELMPQSLATMGIVPLQMKLVYRIGKAHGYTLDRGHIRDFLATAGAGLAAQAVEGYARKLVGGLLGNLMGKGIGGSLGRTAAATATGASLTFAATYAIGQLAVRYYSGGRRMESAVLKDTYSALLAGGKKLAGQHQAAIEQRAATLNPTEVVNLIRQG